MGRRGEARVDHAIRRRFRDGDADAVRLVYRPYGRLVYAVACRILGDASWDVGRWIPVKRGSGQQPEPAARTVPTRAQSRRISVPPSWPSPA